MTDTNYEKIDKEYEQKIQKINRIMMLSTGGAISLGAIESPNRIIVSRFEIIYAVAKIWDTGFYLDINDHPIPVSLKQMYWSNIYPDWTKKKNKMLFENDVDNRIKRLIKRGFIEQAYDEYGEYGRGLYFMNPYTMGEKNWEIVRSLLIQPPRPELVTDLPLKNKR